MEGIALKKSLHFVVIIILFASLTIVSSCSGNNDDPQKENYFEKGKKALSENNFENAIENFTNAINENPEKTELYYYRGLSFLYKMDLEYAAIDFSKVIEFDTTNADAFNNRGLTYTLLGNMEMAIADLDKAIALDSNFAQAYVNRGTAYMNWNNPFSALEDFNKAIELDSNNPMAFYQRAVINYNDKDFDEAAKDYLTAANMGLQKEDLFYSLGNCYFHMKQFDNAAQYYTKALQMNPQNTTALNNRAIAYDKSGKKDLAEMDRETLRRMNTEILDLPEESGDIKYKRFVSKMGEISIELPENWHKADKIDDDVTSMLVSKDSVASVRDYFQVGVNISLNKNMQEKYGVSTADELMEFWKGSSSQNSLDYTQYDVFTQKLFKKTGWNALLNKVDIQITPQSPVLTIFELVLTKENTIFYAYFQAPKTHFNFYEEIFDRAIKSVEVK
jgi:tetratricopeptide (TPR) repeat protein